jgi:tRNA/rRNA methyltransferase
MDLQLVLVEPAGPLNVGSVARLCANFGVSGLRLVAPRCDPNDPDALRMAMAGRPLLQRAERYPHLAAALADRTRVTAAAAATAAGASLVAAGQCGRGIGVWSRGSGAEHR